MTAITVEMFMRFLADRESVRRDMMFPVGTTTHWYATNGYILLRVPAETFQHLDFPALIDAPFTPPAPGLVAQMDSIIDTAFARAETFQPAPAGEPRARERCKACDGDGFVDCDMHYSHDCEECHGAGHLPRFAYHSWRGWTFDADYLARIHALPGAELGWFQPSSTDGRVTLLAQAFRCAGGVGVIMPSDPTLVPAALEDGA